MIEIPNCMKNHNSIKPIGINKMIKTIVIQVSNNFVNNAMESMSDISGNNSSLHPHSYNFYTKLYCFGLLQYSAVG